MTKTKSISIRMTEAEYESIKAKADSAGVSQGRFMVNAAIADGSLTVTDKQKIYQHKAIIQDLAKQLTGRYDDPAAIQLHKEMDSLWQRLK